MKTVTKSLIVVLISLAFLTGCGNTVKFKDDDDRKHFNVSEVENVESEILALDGVESFKIQHSEVDGTYAVLIVEEKKIAKKLAIEAFEAIWAETIGAVDLFVKETGKEDILIQAFKPAGTDKENKWDILL